MDEALIDDATENLDWIRAGAPNSLLDVHSFHCGGAHPGGKELRNVFVDGTLDDVRDQFDTLMNYCANDVKVTLEVLRAVWPRFLQKAPHPVTFAGMLEMGTCYLPVTDEWENYKERSEEAYTATSQRMKQMLGDLAVAALEQHKATSGAVRHFIIIFVIFFVANVLKGRPVAAAS